jgi:hypothetical protein
MRANKPACSLPPGASCTPVPPGHPVRESASACCLRCARKGGGPWTLIFLSARQAHSGQGEPQKNKRERGWVPMFDEGPFAECGPASQSRVNHPGGRPRRQVDPEQIVVLLQQGESLREIARRLHLGYGTLHRVVQAMRHWREPPDLIQNSARGILDAGAVDDRPRHPRDRTSEEVLGTGR